MKFSKKLLSIILSLTMVCTIVGGTGFSATAATKSKYKDLKCGTSYARASISSSSSHNGSSITVSKDGKTKFYYLYAATFGNRCNKNGDNVKYVSAYDQPANDSTTTRSSILPIISGNSTDYYARIASAHIAQKTKNGSQQSVSLSLAYWFLGLSVQAPIDRTHIVNIILWEA